MSRSAKPPVKEDIRSLSGAERTAVLMLAKYFENMRDEGGILKCRFGAVDNAHAPGGDVTALLVRLDDDKVVWIDTGDIRYNRADGIVMTNLDRNDLRHMADERL